MVILGTWEKHSLTISMKPNCLTVSLQRPDGAEVYSFDAAGRMWTAMHKNVSYRRGLDGKIVAKWGQHLGSAQRRWLDPDEARQLEAQARQLMARLLESAIGHEVALDSPIPEDALSALRLAAQFDAQRAAADIAAYHRVYKPVGILPPDQYMAVVLQVAEGCSFNTCTFCNFYKDRPFRIKTPEQLSRHIQEIQQFLGAGMSLRRTIFLGDANALVIPMPKLLPLLDVIHSQMDVERLGGIYAFLDGFSGEKKSVQDYIELSQRGLKRVYVGMESGNAELLQFLKKPGKPQDAVHAVQSMKAAGVAVGVIVLVGAGGKEYAKDHVRDTVNALNAMQLDADDIIYFSELIESEGMQYYQDAYQAQLQPLTSEERLAQASEIESRLVFTEAGGTPHISRYDIREFVY